MQTVPLLIITIMGLLSVATLAGIRIWYARVSVPESISKPELLHVLIKDDAEYSAHHTQELYADLHKLLDQMNAMISLELISGSYGMHFIIVCEEDMLGFVRELFERYYPDAAIDSVGDYAGSIHSTHRLMSTVEFGLARPFSFPIRQFEEFQHDPLKGLFEVMQNTTHPNEIWLQLVLRPAPENWKDAARRLFTGIELSHERMSRVEQKLSQPGFQCILRGLVKADNFNTAGGYFSDIARSLAVFDSPDLNKLVQHKPIQSNGVDYLRYLLVGKTLSEKTDEVRRFELRLLDHFSEDVLTPAELAGLWHLPDLDAPVELTPTGTDLMVMPEHQLLDISSD